MTLVPSLPNSPHRAPPLTPAQKAAIILASLPRETAAAIVAEVADVHLKTFVKAVSELKSVPVQTRLQIAQEFIAEVLGRQDELPAGDAEAHRILAEITDKARAEKLITELGEAGGAPRKNASDLWTKLAAISSDRLIPYLQTQRAPAIAAILSGLPPDRVADLMAAAPLDFVQSALAAIARTEPPDEETKKAIAVAVEEELINAPPAAGDARPIAVGPVTEIVDFLPSSVRDGVLAYLDAADGPVAAAIRSNLLTFQLLPERLTENAVAAAVRTADRETLLRALKHAETNAAPALEFLLANISKRMSEQIREELSAMPAPPAADGEKAQRAVLGIIKGLERNGEIKLKPLT